MQGGSIGTDFGSSLPWGATQPSLPKSERPTAPSGPRLSQLSVLARKDASLEDIQKEVDRRMNTKLKSSSAAKDPLKLYDHRGGLGLPEVAPTGLLAGQIHDEGTGLLRAAVVDVLHTEQVVNRPGISGTQLSTGPSEAVTALAMEPSQRMRRARTQEVKQWIMEDLHALSARGISLLDVKLMLSKADRSGAWVWRGDPRFLVDLRGPLARYPDPASANVRSSLEKEAERVFPTHKLEAANRAQLARNSEVPGNHLAPGLPPDAKTETAELAGFDSEHESLLIEGAEEMFGKAEAARMRKEAKARMEAARKAEEAKVGRELTALDRIYREFHAKVEETLPEERIASHSKSLAKLRGRGGRKMVGPTTKDMIEAIQARRKMLRAREIAERERAALEAVREGRRPDAALAGSEPARTGSQGSSRPGSAASAAERPSSQSSGVRVLPGRTRSNKSVGFRDGWTDLPRARPDSHESPLRPSSVSGTRIAMPTVMERALLPKGEESPSSLRQEEERTATPQDDGEGGVEVPWGLRTGGHTGAMVAVAAGAFDQSRIERVAQNSTVVRPDTRNGGRETRTVGVFERALELVGVAPGAGDEIRREFVVVDAKGRYRVMLPDGRLEAGPPREDVTEAEILLGEGVDPAAARRAIEAAQLADKRRKMVNKGLKVLLRRNVVQPLLAWRKGHVAALQIQRIWRGYAARMLTMFLRLKLYGRMRHMAATAIQRLWRGKRLLEAARAEYLQRQRSAFTIQAFAWRIRARSFARRRKARDTISHFVWRVLVRQRLRRLVVTRRARHEAVAEVHRQERRERYKKKERLALFFQRHFRGWRARQRVRMIRRVRAWAAARIARFMLRLHEKQHALMEQVRPAMEYLATARQAARLIQSTWRMYVVIRETKQMIKRFKPAAIQIQRIVRGALARMLADRIRQRSELAWRLLRKDPDDEVFGSLRPMNRIGYAEVATVPISSSLEGFVVANPSAVVDLSSTERRELQSLWMARGPLIGDKFSKNTLSSLDPQLAPVPKGKKRKPKEVRPSRIIRGSIQLKSGVLDEEVVQAVRTVQAREEEFARAATADVRRERVGVLMNMGMSQEEAEAAADRETGFDRPKSPEGSEGNLVERLLDRPIAAIGPVPHAMRMAGGPASLPPQLSSSSNVKMLPEGVFRAKVLFDKEESELRAKESGKRPDSTYKPQLRPPSAGDSLARLTAFQLSTTGKNPLAKPVVVKTPIRKLSLFGRSSPMKAPVVTIDQVPNDVDDDDDDDDDDESESEEEETKVLDASRASSASTAQRPRSKGARSRSIVTKRVAALLSGFDAVSDPEVIAKVLEKDAKTSKERRKAGQIRAAEVRSRVRQSNVKDGRREVESRMRKSRLASRPQSHAKRLAKVRELQRQRARAKLDVQASRDQQRLDREEAQLMDALTRPSLGKALESLGAVVASAASLTAMEAIAEAVTIEEEEIDHGFSPPVTPPLSVGEQHSRAPSPTLHMPSIADSVGTDYPQGAVVRSFTSPIGKRGVHASPSASPRSVLSDSELFAGGSSIPPDQSMSTLLAPSLRHASQSTVRRPISLEEVQSALLPYPKAAPTAQERFSGEAQTWRTMTPYERQGGDKAVRVREILASRDARSRERQASPSLPTEQLVKPAKFNAKSWVSEVVGDVEPAPVRGKPHGGKAQGGTVARNRGPMENYIRARDRANAIRERRQRRKEAASLQGSISGQSSLTLTVQAARREQGEPSKLKFAPKDDASVAVHAAYAVAPSWELKRLGPDGMRIGKAQRQLLAVSHSSSQYLAGDIDTEKVSPGDIAILGSAVVPDDAADGQGHQRSGNPVHHVHELPAAGWKARVHQRVQEEAHRAIRGEAPSVESAEDLLSGGGSLFLGKVAAAVQPATHSKSPERLRAERAPLVPEGERSPQDAQLAAEISLAVRSKSTRPNRLGYGPKDNRATATAGKTPLDRARGVSQGSPPPVKFREATHVAMVLEEPRAKTPAKVESIEVILASMPEASPGVPMLNDSGKSGADALMRALKSATRLERESAIKQREAAVDAMAQLEAQQLALKPRKKNTT
jgi:hypothetical protein